MDSEHTFLTAGANAHPSAADYDAIQDILAYGAGFNLALWQPNCEPKKGLYALLRFHDDEVNAVRFIPQGSGNPYLITGSADRSICLWHAPSCHSSRSPNYAPAWIQKESHVASVNCIGIMPGLAGIFASGAADGAVHVWKVNPGQNGPAFTQIQKFYLKPSLIPLSLALIQFNSNVRMLAVGGTQPALRIFASHNDGEFEPQTTLEGHEGWIRCLDFVMDSEGQTHVVQLASASQDKYIRLWKIHLQSYSSRDSWASLGTGLKQIDDFAVARTHHDIYLSTCRYKITFEALFVGHEDWVYSVRWLKLNGVLKLLSASADNSVAIWEPDPVDGIWYACQKFGEMSAQKGSTTATGSMGGLMNALWDPVGQSVLAVGRTGGWRRWQLSPENNRWYQVNGIGGHTGGVRGISWTPDGSCLFSVSSDQTTRLFCERMFQHDRSWHEFARPQIHGYDLNCIVALSSLSFVSGAEEKLLRVFEEPEDMALLLERQCKIRPSRLTNLFTADVPVLGLSNKASSSVRHNLQDTPSVFPIDMPRALTPLSDLNSPPLEDHLSKKTLWPEKEKLYGHGHEISSIAISKDGNLIATSCRASSKDHAVIRLFSTGEWKQLSHVLKLHFLTVTSMEFSRDNKLLLSAGRDRQWAVWAKDPHDNQNYSLKASTANAHSKMILSTAWLHSKMLPAFLTGGRDKIIKIWRESDVGFNCSTVITVSSPVLSISDHPVFPVFALGTESGMIKLVLYDQESSEILIESAIDESFCPSLAVHQLSWRPVTVERYSIKAQLELAIASEDRSLRVLKISSMGAAVRNVGDVYYGITEFKQ